MTMMIQEQKYKSAKTSINSGKLPAIVRIWEGCAHMGVSILDYGCGKFDNTKEYLEARGFEYYGYDPYNRPDHENQLAMKKYDYDCAILSNVLNVIAEEKIRLKILREIKEHLKPNGVLFIKIYEGNGSGILKVDERRDSCQLNKKTREYLPEVETVFASEGVRADWVGGVHVITARKEVG